MKTVCRLLAAVTMTVLVSMIYAQASSAGERVTLRFGHDQPEKHPYHKGAVFFADKVKANTAGKADIRVYPAAQLGNELTMLDSLRIGDLDLSISAAPNASTHVPELGFFSVSYLFDSKEHFIRTLTDSQFMSIVQEKVAARNIGFRPLGFLTAGLRSVYNNKRPVKTAADLEGLRMRVMASPIEARIWKALGTLPTSMPFGEIYTAMQTGLINAAEGPPVTYSVSKHYEVAKYLSLTEHQWLVTVLWASSKSWERLPSDFRTAALDAAKEMTTYQINLNAEEDGRVVAEAQSRGIVLNSVDKAEFKQKVAKLQEEVAKELGMERALQRIRQLAREK